MSKHKAVKAGAYYRPFQTVEDKNVTRKLHTIYTKKDKTRLREIELCICS